MWIVSVQRKHTGFTVEFDNEDEAKKYYESESKETENDVEGHKVYLAEVKKNMADSQEGTGMETLVKGQIIVGEKEHKLEFYDYSEQESHIRFDKICSYAEALERTLVQNLDIPLKVYLTWRGKK